MREEGSFGSVPFIRSDTDNSRALAIRAIVLTDGACFEPSIRHNCADVIPSLRARSPCLRFFDFRMVRILSPIVCMIRCLGAS